MQRLADTMVAGRPRPQADGDHWGGFFCPQLSPDSMRGPTSARRPGLHVQSRALQGSTQLCVDKRAHRPLVPQAGLSEGQAKSPALRWAKLQPRP